MDRGLDTGVEVINNEEGAWDVWAGVVTEVESEVVVG